MEIPYNVTARPDTGLYNSKLGIWLFLASEVMLFGGLFSAYIFLRLGAEPGYWPVGLLNVPVGTMNTFVLIFSSVTVVYAWAALKMRQYNRYFWCMLITIICGVIFLGVKLLYEYPQKFHHFGVIIKKEALAKYEPYLGNEYLKSKGLHPRVEISGHLLAAPKGSPYEASAHGGDHGKHDSHGEHHGDAHAAPADAYVLKLDPANANPLDPQNERPVFWPRPITEKTATIAKEDVQSASPYVPRHSSYFSSYFLITGLHGLHVLGGIVVFAYFLLFNRRLYQKNPEHLANRVEVAGLFWHFVDLVWIFVFPIFYLL